MQFMFSTQMYASLVAQRLKRLPPMWETQVRSLGWEDPLEKEMATHSGILACRTPWSEEPGGLQSMGSQTVWHDWATSLWKWSAALKWSGRGSFKCHWPNTRGRPLAVTLLSLSWWIIPAWLLDWILHFFFFTRVIYKCKMESQFWELSSLPKYYDLQSCLPFLLNFLNLPSKI